MSENRSLRTALFRKKPLASFVVETGATTEGGELNRSFGVFALTMFGVGATIGTGIFIVLNTAVPEAGPGVIVSFAIAGVTAALTALCYAEMASMIPVSGSSYSYSYATLGELVAYGVGWCLLLEYGVSAGAIVVGWQRRSGRPSASWVCRRAPRRGPSSDARSRPAGPRPRPRRPTPRPARPSQRPRRPTAPAAPACPRSSSSRSPGAPGPPAAAPDAAR